MAIGRNEPCSCGSGQKYKNCCAGKSTRGISKGLILLLAAIALVAAFGVVGAITGRKKAVPTTPATPNAAAPATAGRPQPGPAPPGKVWSVEHGHWHDASPGGAAGAPAAPPQPAPAAFTPGPKPPGPTPAGKVWSTEHGHWHDAPK